jgi:xanthine dehydrogenase small subunit
MRDYVLIYVNGARHEIRGIRAFQSLSDFLRYDLGLTGTKVVCAEGDCGSCTIFLGRPASNGIDYRTACSCIQFLYQLDCTHIVTVEGLKYDGKLNPVQEAMVTCQGSQCGFCTPGFIVSMYAMLQQSDRERVSPKDVQIAWVGNLCRCTGYESIMRAGASVDTSQVRPLSKLYADDSMTTELQTSAADAVCVGWAPPTTSDPWAVPSQQNKVFFKPATIDEACRFRRDNPGCTIISGGTDIGVQLNKCLRDPKVILSLSGLSELRSIRLENDTIVASALASIADLEAISRDALPEYARLLYYFGSPPIKNAGTLGGNIANGSPIGDSMPALYVLNAQIELTGVNGARRVNINDFYTGYKTNVSQPDELITRVHIPIPASGDIFRLFKVSKRKDLDISAFTAAIWMRRDGAVVSEARIAYGGVGPNIIRLRKTEAFFVGKSLNETVIRDAGEIARQEIAPISDVRGSAEFRAQLGQNILRKFFAEMSDDRGNGRRNGDGNGHPEPQNVSHPPLKPHPARMAPRNLAHEETD